MASFPIWLYPKAQVKFIGQHLDTSHRQSAVHCYCHYMNTYKHIYSARIDIAACFDVDRRQF